MEKITPSQLREIHKLLLSAIHKTEALYKELPEDSLTHQTLFRLSNNIESVIFNAFMMLMIYYLMIFLLILQLLMVR